VLFPLPAGPSMAIVSGRTISPYSWPAGSGPGSATSIARPGWWRQF